MGNFKKMDILQKTVHCNAYRKFFPALSCYVCMKKKLKSYKNLKTNFFK